jgi:predicted RNase H-like HicB family nuclease
MARKPVKVEQEHLTTAERLSMPYARVLIPEAGGGYRAEILEFPGCMALGDDPAEAFSELEAAAEDWLEAAVEMGAPIPPPLEETDFSGKLVLRLPKSLHRRAAVAADHDGVSLNQFIATCIAEHVGQKSAIKSDTHVFHSICFMPTREIQRATPSARHWLISDMPFAEADFQGMTYANR